MGFSLGKSGAELILVRATNILFGARRDFLQRIREKSRGAAFLSLHFLYLHFYIWILAPKIASFQAFFIALKSTKNSEK